MNEEKKLILEMLKDGKITTEEAEKLLDAINDEKSTQKKRKNIGKKNMDNVFQALSEKLDNIAERLSGKEGESFSKTINDWGINFSSTLSDLGKDLEETFENIIDNARGFSENASTKNLEIVESTASLSLDNIENPVLDFKAVNGNINLEAKEVEEINLSIKCSFKSGEINSGDKLYDFYTDDNRLIFSPRYSGVNISIEGAIPKKHYETIYMQTKNGGLTLKGAEADKLDFETSNGKIYLRNIVSEDVDLTTKNSRIELEKVSAENILARTSNGKLKLGNIDSEVLDAQTSNSSLEAYSVNTKRAELKTTNSQINADSILSDELTLITSNAKVELSNYEVKENIDIKTGNGSIKVDAAPKIPVKYILSTSMGSIDINSDNLIFSDADKGLNSKYIEAQTADFDNNLIFTATTSNGSIKIG